MKVEYIGHACLLIDTGKLKIVSDPWFRSAAYCGQWHIFPKPLNIAALDEAEVITLSHGHEDHLHVPSLEQLRKNKQVFYPYIWYGGTKEYLSEIGYTHVTEALSRKSYTLADGTKITYLPNSLDSIIVIESNGFTLVNVNDALHACDTAMIDEFVAAIRGTWPKIDYLFCGFGGASFFPNCFHLPDKDDVAIGRLREQVFAHNFCRVLDGLRPQIAVPFAADFALLSAPQRWINEVRFPRSLLRKYYQLNFNAATTSIIEMYPGDVLEQYELQAVSPYRAQMKSNELNHLIDEQYASEIAAIESPQWLTTSEVETLQARLLRNISERAQGISAEKIKQIIFSVKVSDVAEQQFFNIAFSNGSPQIERASEPSLQALLVIKTNSQILNYSFDSDWGGEAMIIGYGCEIHIFDRATVKAGLDQICLQLLHRLPVFKAYLKQAPARGLWALLRDSALRNRAMHTLTRASSQLSDILDRDHWLLDSAEQIRARFNLPEFSF